MANMKSVRKIASGMAGRRQEVDGIVELEVEEGLLKVVSSQGSVTGSQETPGHTH